MTFGTLATANFSVPIWPSKDSDRKNKRNIALDMADTQSLGKCLRALDALDGLTYASLVLLALLLVDYFRIALKPGLRPIPGPFLARFTKLYRVFKVAQGDCPHFYLRLHEKYGRIVRTGPNTVSLSAPEAVQVIYGTNHNYRKSAFYDTMTPFYNDTRMPSMFTARDPIHHSELRKPVSQKFSMTSIKAMEPFADECTGIFLQAIRDLEGQDVDLGVWLQWYAFDVIGAITFQRRFGFLEERRDIGNMISDIEKVLKYAATVGQIPEWHPYLVGNLWLSKVLASQPFVKVPDPLRTIVKFTQECVDEYDRNPAAREDRPDFLAWLRNDSKKGKPMSDRDLINHLSNNLLAGSDTTAISLRAVFYYLVQHPEAYRKVRQEIANADRDGKLSEYVTYAQCLELPYLQAVMKEAMRCHSGVSMPLERLVPEGGAEFCGIHLRAGTNVGINPVVIHNDKTIYGEDAACFRPERWTESSAERVKIMDRHLLTFGAGVRTCIGKNISIMEMGKLVPQVLRHFDVEWASQEKSWRIETYWFAKQHGLICRLKSQSRPT